MGMIEDGSDQSTSLIATGVFRIQEAQFRTAEAGARIEFKTKTPARMILYVTILHKLFRLTAQPTNEGYWQQLVAAGWVVSFGGYIYT